jgi:hypothetical protein
MAKAKMRASARVYKKRASRPLGDRLQECTAYDELTGCWLWIGNIGTNGYGRISVDNRLQSVHRTSYEFHRGPVPEGKVLMHTCDIRCCINPDHLAVGSKLENTADMMAKGRNRYSGRKLGPDAIRHIRAWTMTGLEYAELYGVTLHSVSQIRNRRAWAHVPD